MSVAGRGWSLPVSTLCTVLNSRTDQGVMVPLHLGTRKPSAKPRFLISSRFFQAFRSIHRRSGKKEQMTSCAAVDLIAQRTRQSRAQHTQQRHVRHGGWWGVAVVLVVGRSVSARYTSPAHARIAIASGFCFVFHLSQLVTSSYSGTSALCFSRGMVPVPMVGLRASRFDTASEVPPGELPAHSHLLTHISRAVP